MRILPTAVFPAKAGIQIHPERFVGVTWVPAFAGKTEEGTSSKRPPPPVGKPKPRP